MPRDTNSMPICSPTKQKCVEEAIETVEQSAFDTTGTIGAKCACLPACTELKFHHSMTQGILSNAKSLRLKKSLLDGYPKLKDDTFVRENIAVVHIYHENLYFLKHERNEVGKSIKKNISVEKHKHDT